ncbi:MAG: ABC transporter substrate-binding protein [Confluentimicrobium sp.]|jgi:NitT/TauT family transport system substrate-binding protein|uniref:ABC transporter substrate-binding protein n=1 Tax=Actibacterium sp. TaxID=1872125 RepID=UPI00050FF69A|nr:ABC transporter substrate-binding protein [Actibacterium sp.]KGB81156.1 ABC transporter substrate-binding protein [Rhodovulum sp. NI22]MBC58252.1 ABC transporter substrate-binding protein [Actibacterium sp.]MDY6860057.1 ABC transporter substrate-binding protein [Pseudomonadota bacterium]|tara:strand:+ start:1128 stop:2132 length:1005 start_codon:yes stop_codon:yes gene_type:complete
MLQKSMATLAALALGATAALADTKVPFALDWKFEGPAAPYFAAADNGYFAEAGIEVEIAAGQGSLDAIPKVATGAYPVGFADINSLVKFLDQNPGAPVIAVMMTYDKPPFAVIGRKSLGIETPKDLEGKILGAPPPDGAWAQFPVFAGANGLDMSKITVEPVGFPTREPMLAEGKVDAVTGYAFSSVLNLGRLGVPEEDVSTILMADYGLALYGNAVIVNTDFAAANPDLVKGFLAAIAKGWTDAIADPEAGAEMVLKRNPAADLALETRRLQLVIDTNVVTDYTLANGMGNIDPARMEKALEQIAETYEFKTAPDASLYFTDAYLPEGNFPLN